MSNQTIDTYKLTSLEEPSDEILSLLMKEVAEEAKRKGEEANRKFFDGIALQMKSAMQDWTGETPYECNKRAQASPDSDSRSQWVR